MVIIVSYVHCTCGFVYYSIDSIEQVQITRPLTVITRPSTHMKFMNCELKTQLKVFILPSQHVRKNIHAIYCSKDFFQSTTKLGMVAVFTKFPQKVGILYIAKITIHCLGKML